MCRNSGSTVATVLPLRACSWSGIRGEKWSPEFRLLS